MYGHELFHSGINLERIEKFERYWIRYLEKIPIVPIDTYLKEHSQRYIELAKHKKIIQENLPNHINDRIIKHNITYKELLTY